MQAPNQAALSTVTRLRTPLAREEILGLLWAAAGPVRVPARCWPMQIALDVLEAQAPLIGRVERVLEAWPVSISSHGRRRSDVDGILRDLAIAGFLVVEGRGWDAGYRPTERWLAQGTAALASLTASERASVKVAAQRLVASVTIWSKKSLVELSDRSATS
jgi:hypothetical protein